MGLKGTQTEKNILTAFAGESQARNRYDYASSKARKEGYRQVAEIFEKTALQEKEHAKRLFKMLEGGDVDVAAAFPAGDELARWEAFRRYVNAPEVRRLRYAGLPLQKKQPPELLRVLGHDARRRLSRDAGAYGRACAREASRQCRARQCQHQSVHASDSLLWWCVSASRLSHLSARYSRITE